MLDPNSLPITNTQNFVVKHKQVSSWIKQVKRTYGQKTYDDENEGNTHRWTIMGKIRQTHFKRQAAITQYNGMINNNTNSLQVFKTDGTVENYPDHPYFSFVKPFETWDQSLQQIEMKTKTKNGKKENE